MALSSDQIPRTFQGGWARETRRPASGQYASGKKGFLNSITISVDGNAQPLVSGTALQALCLLSAAGIANGGIYLRAIRAAVRVSYTAGAAEAITVGYNVGTNTYDVAITFVIASSTANTIVQLIRQNGEANRLLRAKAQGTGAGLPTAAALTAVPFLAMLGSANVPIDNSASPSPLPLEPYVGFECGTLGILADPVAPPVVNSMATLIDDNTVSAAVDALAFQAPVRAVDPRGMIFVDLMEAV